MSTIIDVQPVSNEVVIQDRVATNEFRILEIQENVLERFVRATIEFGPFTVVPVGPPQSNQTTIVGTSRRGIDVWSGTEYDAVRDTWKNTDLIAKITTLIEAENT